MREFNDLRKLRHAVGVAQAGSFTAAAQTLSITQSALTKSVAELESILGLALFERLPRGIRLTAHGEEFIRKAQQILGDTHQLMHNLGEIQSLATGQLRVTVTPPALINFIEHATAAFSQVYPGISLQISQASIGVAAKSLLSGEADLAAGPVKR